MIKKIIRMPDHMGTATTEDDLIGQHGLNIVDDLLMLAAKVVGGKLMLAVFTDDEWGEAAGTPAYIAEELNEIEDFYYGPSYAGFTVYILDADNDADAYDLAETLRTFYRDVILPEFITLLFK